MGRWKDQNTSPVSWENCMQIKKQQLQPDREQQFFKIEKEVWKVCILSPCLFNLYAEYIMQNADWIKQKLESRLLGEISITSNMQMIPL